jgi:hypothetical protein
MAFFCLFLISQVANGQDIVKDVAFSNEQAKVQLADETPISYFVEIGGADNYYWKQRVNFTNEISLSNLNADGEKFEDGQYSLRITPVFELTPEQRTELLEMRNANDQEGIAAYRKANGLPAEVNQFSMNFQIQNGKFVNANQKEGELNLPTKSSQWEIDHPSLYASINPIFGMEGMGPDFATDNTSNALDIVHLDDVIIQFSLCIGNDCVNGENFGFDTQRLKENNLRIHFDDTSNSGSFPSNDWRIVINDSSNGGSSYFVIQDATASRDPFRIDAGAPTDALRVDASGDLGLGTSNPVVEIHVADGDSPTLRLEQNGSSGFTAQSYDVAANETNFFIRDVTNGSKLPFRLIPSAPTSSLLVDSDGDVLIGGTASGNRPRAGADLDVLGTNSLLLPIGTTAQQPTGIEGMIRGNSDLNSVEYFNGTSWLDLGASGGGSSPWTLSGGNVYRSSGNVGIGTSTPGAGSPFDTKFEIVGSGSGVSGRTDMTISNTNATSAARLTVENSDGNYFQLQASGSSYSTGANGSFGTKGIDMSFISDTDIPSGGTHIIKFLTGGYNATNERMRIDASGNVGIGCTNPSSKLHVNGTISTTAASVSTSITCSSDRRFKKNISPLQNSLEKVLNLQGVNYDWRIDEFPNKHFNEGRQLGFIAQEIEEVLPLVVQTDAEGYKAVDYSRLTPVLVEAVKEQQAIIDAQQAEINSLQSQLASLEELKSQVAALTQMVMKQNDTNASKAQVGDE